MAIFTNQATLTYNGITTTSNIATGELLEVLSVTKTAILDEYSADSTVTYVVSIRNSGTTDFTGLTLTDTLGGYSFGTPETTLYPLTYVDGSVQYYANGVLQTPPSVEAGPPMTIAGLTVPAGGNGIVIYQANVNAYAPLEAGGTIENTVTLNGSIATPISATESIAATTEPVLTVLKSLSPNPVAENGTLTYTFTIQNTGSSAATATDDVTITDNFDPRLSDISVTFNGTPWAEPTNYNYAEETGVFSTVPGQITVPAATYEQDPTTGVWSTTPGTSTLVVTGTV